MDEQHISTSNLPSIPAFFGGHPDEVDRLKRADEARFREFRADVLAVAERYGIIVSADLLWQMWRGK